MKSARTSLLRLFFVLFKRVNCGDLIVQGEPNLFVRETLVATPRRHAVFPIVATDSVDHPLSQNILALFKSWLPLSEIRHCRRALDAQQMTGPTGAQPNAAPCHQPFIRKRRHLDVRFCAFSLLTAAEQGENRSQADGEKKESGALHLKSPRSTQNKEMAMVWLANSEGNGKTRIDQLRTPLLAELDLQGIASITIR